jgi:hypothetical protein
MVHSGDGWQVDLSAEIPEVREQPRAGIEAATRTVLTTSMHEDSLFPQRRCWQADLPVLSSKKRAKRIPLAMVRSGQSSPRKAHKVHERRIGLHLNRR